MFNDLAMNYNGILAQ